MDALWLEPFYGLLLFEDIATILPILSIPNRRFEWWRIPEDFLARHASSWPAHETRLMFEILHDLVLQIHLRSFIPGLNGVKLLNSCSVASLRLEREGALQFLFSDGHRNPSLRAPLLAIHRFGAIWPLRYFDSGGSYRRSDFYARRWQVWPCRAACSPDWRASKNVYALRFLNGRRIGITHCWR